MSALDELTLVAHRGYPLAFPENTLLGFQQAVAHGATHVETDVQCTRDGIPVLYHDADTQRLSGVPGLLLERSLAEVNALRVCVPGRFGERFRDTPVATLHAFATWLARHPAVTAFVEIKQESLQRFGVAPVVSAVTQALAGVRQRCVLISFDDRCVAYAARHHDLRSGWVLPAWDRRVEHRARQLSPDFLFAEDLQMPDDAAAIWPGPWQWAVYVVNRLDTALEYVRRGVRLVETDAIGELLDEYRAGPAAWSKRD